MPPEWSFPRVLPQMMSFPPLSGLWCLPVTQSASQDGPAAPPSAPPVFPLRPHLLLPPATSLYPHPRPPESSCPGPLYSVPLPTLQLSPWPGSNVPFPWLNPAGHSSLSSFLRRTDHPLVWRIFHLSLITILFSRSKMQAPWGQGVIGSFVCSSFQCQEHSRHRVGIGRWTRSPEGPMDWDKTEEKLVLGWEWGTHLGAIVCPEVKIPSALPSSNCPTNREALSFCSWLLI